MKLITSITILKKLLLKVWKFPWLKVSLIMCLIGFVGMSVMQSIGLNNLKGDVTQITEQSAISEIGGKMVSAAYAEDGVPDDEPEGDPPVISPEEQARIDAVAEARVKAEARARSAQGATAKFQETLTGAANVLAKMAVFLLKVIGALLMFMLYWMADLMDNTFILDGSMGDKLQIIWMFIRNIVNVAFAIILVIVAFINVAGYGAGEGNYALKKFLPKMAMALIAINFTFLGARVVLDVNNVLTTAVLSLPQNVPDLGQYTAESQRPLRMYAKYKCSFNKTETTEWIDNLKKKYNAEGVATTAEAGGTERDTAALGTEGTGLYQQGLPVGSFFDVCVADIGGSIKLAGTNNIDANGLVEIGNLNQLSSRNFVWVMATRFQGIQNIAKVPLEAKDWESLLMNANFALLFGIIYAIAYVAMFIILIIRVIVLWICIALSPLIALEILFPELMGGFKMGDEDLKTMFLNHAFVPLKMAVPMSIGFIMVSQMSLLGLGDFSKEILLTGGEFTRGGSVHRILYGVASVAFIWIAVFSATDKVKGKSVIDKIKGGAENVGKFIAKTPLQTLPLVPVAGKMIPLAAVNQMWKTIERMPGRHAVDLGSESAQLLMGGKGAPKIRATRALEDLQGSVNKGTTQNIYENWSNLTTLQKDQSMRLMATASGATMGEGETLAQLVSSNRPEAERIMGEQGLTTEQIKEMLDGKKEDTTTTAGTAYSATVNTSNNQITVTPPGEGATALTNVGDIDAAAGSASATDKAKIITALSTGNMLTHFSGEASRLQAWSGANNIKAGLAREIYRKLQEEANKITDATRATAIVRQLNILAPDLNAEASKITKTAS